MLNFMRIAYHKTTFMSSVDLTKKLWYNDIDIFCERSVGNMNKECIRLKASKYIDSEAQCFYKYISGNSGIYCLHCHEYYEIFLTTKGTATHEINGHIINLPEGSLVFIRPDDRHSFIYETDSQRKSSHVNLAFSRETAELLFLYLSDGFPSEALLSSPMPPQCILSKDEKKRLLVKIGKLDTVKWNDKKQLKMQMRKLLVEIFAGYFSQFSEYKQSEIPQWLVFLSEEMKKPENFVGGADKMTELSGKTKEHLSRNVKKHFGITLSEYINNLRINYAANLLLNTNKPVLDICFECGFQNLSWFYSVFEKKFGISPGEFKRNNSQFNHGIK